MRYNDSNQTMHPKATIHYLDDFILVTKSLSKAEEQKQLLVSTCSMLGVPLEPSKLVGPVTCLTFLGIEIDTMALQIRLPEDKLTNLRRELSQVVSKRVIDLKESTVIHYRSPPICNQSGTSRETISQETIRSARSGFPPYASRTT